MYTPKEIAENYLSACRTKAALPLGRMFLLACLAGAFVALAGVASTAAAATVGDPRWQSSSPAACFRPASPWSSWPEASSSPATIS